MPAGPRTTPYSGAPPYEGGDGIEREKRRLGDITDVMRAGIAGVVVPSSP